MRGRGQLVGSRSAVFMRLLARIGDRRHDAEETIDPVLFQRIGTFFPWINRVLTCPGYSSYLLDTCQI